MSEAYDAEHRQLARRVAAELDMEGILREGCYTMQAGPSFETIGEARALAILGGDVAGKLSAFYNPTRGRRPEPK